MTINPYEENLLLFVRKRLQESIIITQKAGTTNISFIINQNNNNLIFQTQYNDIKLDTESNTYSIYTAVTNFELPNFTKTQNAIVGTYASGNIPYDEINLYCNFLSEEIVKIMIQQIETLCSETIVCNPIINSIITNNELLESNAEFFDFTILNV